MPRTRRTVWAQPPVGADAMVEPHVLVVDDEVEVGRFLEALLHDEKGYRVTVANSGAEARSALESFTFDLALLDLKLPDVSGIDLLREIRGVTPGCPVIIMTGFSTVRSAVEAVKLGAYDYVDKPFDELEELEETIDRALGVAGVSGTPPENTVALAAAHGIVLGEGSPMGAVLEVARKVAGKGITVLLSGATGTGKECVARFIHATSRRADRPFIGVNCGAFTETLLASELFGHEKGAFTGAANRRRGIFELADGGTLFLDEIGEASPGIQVKLLKVLEKQEFMRVGGEKPLQVDVRILAATNVDLERAVDEGRFRKDLFYRLDVVSLHLPPLRDRPGDIDALMKHFVDQSLPPAQRGRVEFSAPARQALLRYPWPGNVRELANVITGMMALRDGDRLDAGVLPVKVAEARTRSRSGGRAAPALDQDMDATVAWWGERLFDQVRVGATEDGLPEVVDTLKELGHRVAADVIRRALEQTGGDRAAAAGLLGVTPRLLRYYLRERGQG